MKTIYIDDLNSGYGNGFVFATPSPNQSFEDGDAMIIRTPYYVEVDYIILSTLDDGEEARFRRLNKRDALELAKWLMIAARDMAE